MAQFDATEVLALMKRRGFVPSSSSGFTDAEFILAAAEEIESQLLPRLVKMNSKHLLRTQDQTIVAGTSQYRVPDRCVNNGIYSVWIVNASGGIVGLDEVDVGDIPKLGISVAPGQPAYYAFEGPLITLFPPPASAAGTLRVKYQVRPNRLVPVASCGIITGTPVAGASTLTVTTNFPSATAGPYDIIRGRGSFEHLGMDLAGSRSTVTVTLTAGVPSGVGLPVAGDYVCNVGETPVPQLPHGLHLAVACRAVASIIAVKGNRELAKWLIAEASDIEKQVLESLVPRNQSEQQGFTNPWWG